MSDRHVDGRCKSRLQWDENGLVVREPRDDALGRTGPQRIDRHPIQWTVVIPTLIFDSGCLSSSIWEPAAAMQPTPPAVLAIEELTAAFA